MRSVVRIGLLASVIGAASSTAFLLWNRAELAVPASAAVAKLDVFVMSQCQFSLDLLAQLVPVAERLGPRVELRISHVGQPSADGNFSAPHGTAESLGNKLQLCARDVGGNEAWLAFLACQARSADLPPEGWQECARSAEIDQGTLGSCAFGRHGDELLADSFRRAEEAQVVSTPSIQINGVAHAGGRSTAIIARALCSAMKDDTSSACRELTTTPRVSAVVLEDRRCVQPACRTESLQEFLRYAFANVDVRVLDWSDAEAQRLAAAHGATTLPIALLSEEAAQDDWGFAQTKSAVRVLADAEFPHLIQMPSSWDPRHPVEPKKVVAPATPAPSTTAAASIPAAQASL